MVLRLRAELQIKQSNFELNPAKEKQIESEILHGLEEDLAKLLQEQNGGGAESAAAVGAGE
jgi:hypothetical protein